jgi:hypothetical protein
MNYINAEGKIANKLPACMSLTEIPFLLHTSTMLQIKPSYSLHPKPFYAAVHRSHSTCLHAYTWLATDYTLSEKGKGAALTNNILMSLCN